MKYLNDFHWPLVIGSLLLQSLSALSVIPYDILNIKKTSVFQTLNILKVISLSLNKDHMEIAFLAPTEAGISVSIIRKSEIHDWKFSIDVPSPF